MVEAFDFLAEQRVCIFVYAYHILVSILLFWCIWIWAYAFVLYFR